MHIYIRTFKDSKGEFQTIISMGITSIRVIRVHVGDRVRVNVRARVGVGVRV